MQPALHPHRAPRAARWRVAFVSGLAVVAVAGGALIAFPQQHLQAQQARVEKTQLLPNGAPSSFADLVERVKPAVVSVQVTSDGPKVTRRRMPRIPDLPGPFEEFFKKKFGKKGVPRPSRAQGSGFVISADGYVVTNNHVIADASEVEVSFDRTNKYEADVIGTDERTDLALLKIKEADGKTFPFVKFADAKPRVGEWVVAVGNPFGLGGTVTAGIVSAHGRSIGPSPYDFMQVDAAVNKGNSGGPSFNLEGEVVGVNTAIYSPTGVSVGIAFAIPSTTARGVIEQLKTGNPVERGWLGVRIQNVDQDTAESLGLDEAKGALVAEVQRPSPAAEAGLKSGDTILAVNDTEIVDSRDLARRIASFEPGTEVNVKIMREQKNQTVPVKLGLLPSAKELSKKKEPRRSSPSATELDQLGLTVSPVTGSRREGLVVTGVDEDTDAAEKIRVGDVIIEAGHNPVRDPEDLVEAIKEANRLERTAVLLKIRSGSETRFVAVQLERG